VVVGSGSSIWFGSVVRGDKEPIVIVAGRQLALAVADKVIERARQMGGEP
jgi:carbonic anhydrase/acetyltransferase-like protein (isoleucine patch superfamily)